MKKSTLLLLTLLCWSFTTFDKKTIFTGTVTTDYKNKEDVFGLFIEFRIDTVAIAKSIIDENGKFKISTTVESEFDVYCCGFGIGEVYIQTIKRSDKDTVYLNIQIPKTYTKHFGKAVCPKCNKHDQTVPIRYGLESAIVIQHINSIGDTTILPYDKKNYYANTCVVSDQKYFCKRDKIKF